MIVSGLSQTTNYIGFFAVNKMKVRVLEWTVVPAWEVGIYISFIFFNDKTA
jgi:hypothetical protein